MQEPNKQPGKFAQFLKTLQEKSPDFLKKFMHKSKQFLQILWQKIKQGIRWIDRKFGSEAAAESKASRLAQEAPAAYYFHIVIGTIKTLSLYLISTGLILAALFLGIGLGYFAKLVQPIPVPTYTSMKSQIENVDQSSTIYFDKQVKIGTLKSDLVRTPIKSKEMTPYLTQAITATEDEYFYKHNGVVPKALVRALFSDVTGVGAQTGGSTLTQQLVKLQLLNSETTFKRKASEILLALRVNNYFTKGEIIEAYLNVATFGRNNKGQNIAGVQEAALGIFGKSAKDLTLPEAAFIAGLPQSPSVYTPFTQSGKLKKDLSAGLKRKDTVLFRMYREGSISKKEYQAAKKVDLKSEFLPQSSAGHETQTYGYVYNLVTDEARDILMKQLYKADGYSDKRINDNEKLYTKYYNDADGLLRHKGYQVYSTIDKKTYDSMQQVVTNFGPKFGKTYSVADTDPVTGDDITVQQPVQTGGVMLDNQTGKVISFIGGRDFSLNQTNHAFNTKRSPGSTIKPLLVYGTAINEKIIGTQTPIADFKADFGSYAPTDYGNEIQNRFIPAREAMAMSYNLPAVNLYNEVKKKINPKTYMDNLGLKFTDKDYSQLGLALGGTEHGISVLDQTSAFTTLSNEGTHVDPYVIEKIVDPAGKEIYHHETKKTKVYSPATAFIVSDMMKSVISEGTATQLDWQLDFNTKNLAGKTGTSNDYHDVWFVGSTTKVTMATWMGYDATRNLPESSSTTNQTFWSQLANTVYAENPKLLDVNDVRKRPSGVVSSQVMKRTGLQPGIVDINGVSRAISGSMTTSLFYNTKAGKMKYKFAIGGTDSNYRSFWTNFFGGGGSYGIVTSGDDDDSVVADLPRGGYFTQEDDEPEPTPTKPVTPPAESASSSSIIAPPTESSSASSSSSSQTSSSESNASSSSSVPITPTP